MMRLQWPRALGHRLRLLTTSAGSPSRPALPFLAPASSRRFTTQPRRGLSLATIVKWVAVYGATTGSFFVIAYVWQEEGLERQYPTPRVWAHWSRSLMHTALAVVDRTREDPGGVDWIQAASLVEVVVRRMEDPKGEGEGIVKVSRDEVDIDSGAKYSLDDFISASAPLGFDVSSKPEEWRRGYHQTLMLLAQGAEHLEGAMTHRQTGRTYRREYMIGPSYPNPLPLPPHERGSAPREHECEPAFEPPQNYYLRILTTRGFTHRQRIDAALACAAFYEFKNKHDLAEKMHLWALDLAVASTPPHTPPPFNRSTFILHDPNTPPSANVLDTLTALATFFASRGNTPQALPMLISLLRARRQCPSPAPVLSAVPELPGFEQPSKGSWIRFMTESAYPAPPPDGTAPPLRDALAKCREAALGLYLGEILFAASKLDDGLGWTREAVDLAEEQLRAMQSSLPQSPSSPQSSSASPKTVCRECLSTGLRNWSQMATLLAQNDATKPSNPFSALWKTTPSPGRWAEEVRVVEARVKRTSDLLRQDERVENARLSALVVA